MNKRDDLLNAIYERVYHKKHRNFLNGISDESLLSILTYLARYYEVNDFETSYIHKNIFTELYINRNFKSYEEIANNYHINIYTLDRYRQRYNRLAKRLLEEKIKSNFS